MRPGANKKRGEIRDFLGPSSGIALEGRRFTFPVIIGVVCSGRISVFNFLTAVFFGNRRIIPATVIDLLWSDVHYSL